MDHISYWYNQASLDPSDSSWINRLFENYGSDDNISYDDYIIYNVVRIMLNPNHKFFMLNKINLYSRNTYNAALKKFYHENGDHLQFVRSFSKEELELIGI